MNKIHCDLCDSVLKNKKTDDGLGHGSTHWVVTEWDYFFHIALPFMRKPWTTKKITVCSECIQDFKEFIIRKSNIKRKVATNGS